MVRKLPLFGGELLGLLLLWGDLLLTAVLLSVSGLRASLAGNTSERLACRAIGSSGSLLCGGRARKRRIVAGSDSHLLLFLQLFGLKLTLQIGNIVIGIVLHRRLRRLVLACLRRRLLATGAEDRRDNNQLRRGFSPGR